MVIAALLFRVSEACFALYFLSESDSSYIRWHIGETGHAVLVLRIAVSSSSLLLFSVHDNRISDDVPHFTLTVSV